MNSIWYNIWNFLKGFNIDKFEHGGDIYSFAKANGVLESEVIDFSSNINFISQNIEIDTEKYSKYPDFRYLDFKQKLSNRYRIKPKNIELFNGGSSAIFSIFRNLKFKKVNLLAPIYLEYKKASLLFNKEIVLVNRFKDLDFKAFDSDSLIILVNPSTPDGKIYREDFILKLLESKAKVLVDESFLDFSDSKSMFEYIDLYKNLYILKSLTKFYSLAGARVGFIASDSKNIKNLNSFEPSWAVSSLDLAYFSKILNDEEFINLSKKANFKNRKLLFKILNDSNLFSKVYKSKGNFLLAKLKKSNAKKLQNRLAKHNILIRDCSNFDFLDERFVRFAVKSKSDLYYLKDALENL